ncbi:MAG TPA: hypothetical protein VJ783_31350 [Pirellulales bacterium]|nr:hypothetical protein [Pirellulales bacterium]
MAMTFDATLKDMGRESAQSFLAAFDRPPALPVRLLNVDLSTVTRAADLIIGLGEPLVEIVHFEFQSSAAAWKHADLLVYNALLYAQHHVPVHTAVSLLRDEAAHTNLTGTIHYAARPEHGKMDFGYQVVRLWERPAEELLTFDVGVVPLAILGRLPDGVPLEDGLATIARRIVERLLRDSPREQAKRLLTDALLLAGLRVRRDIARRIFQGVHVMQESDTYLMILDEGRAKATRENLIVAGEMRLRPCEEAMREELAAIADPDRLRRMFRRAFDAESWREILDTP